MAEELDARVWRELPAEILERVLRWLPLSVLCKLRAVCKHWNTLPTVRAEQRYILDIACNTRTRLRRCWLYNPTTNAWDFINLSFLLERSRWTPQVERFCSDGGLLCVWGNVLERDLRFYFVDIVPHYTLLVCNPLTKRWKILPGLDAVHQRSVDLVMKRECSGEYKIFVVVLAYTGEPGVHLRHYMYDSASGSWTLLLKLHRGCSDVSLLRCGSIVFDGVYYCVSGGGRQAYELFAYDITEHSWIAAGVKMELSSATTQVQFVVSAGRLLLMASVFEKELYFSVSEVRRDGTMAFPAGYVFPPTNFTWKRGVAVAFRDSIILASESKSMAATLLTLSADLKEVKLITSTSCIPTSQRYTLTSLANVSFDVQAMV